MIPIIVLAAVFILIAVRKVGNTRLQIWQIMLLGAAVVLITGQISPANALFAVNVDVMLFLFGMFVIGAALEESGYLAHISCRLFSKVKSGESVLLVLIFGAGLASALLMNDTLAIIGTPVVLMLAKERGLPARAVLIALAVAVTTGSVMSPIGNPQNLLIAVGGGVPAPFITFLKYLFVPTMINLAAAFFLVQYFFRADFRAGTGPQNAQPIKDQSMARLCRMSLALLILLIIVKIALVWWQIEFRLTYIALAAMLPLLLFSPQRLGLMKKVDWHTLVFFAAMFVLMQSVWDAGFFQSLLKASNVDLASTGFVMAISIVLSQFISNVPLVALYLPMLAQAGTSTVELMALAAGSTIAGNLTILGAASNVIIIQNAESKFGKTLSFLDFFKIGLPLTLINTVVYLFFLRLIA